MKDRFSISELINELEELCDRNCNYRHKWVANDRTAIAIFKPDGEVSTEIRIVFGYLPNDSENSVILILTDDSANPLKTTLYDSG